MKRDLVLIFALCASACAPRIGSQVSFHPIDALGRVDSSIELVGTYRRPPVDSGSPRAIVLVHGLSADRSQFDFMADTLAAIGFATLTFDVRGHGASGGDFPIDTPANYSIAANDLRGALAWLRDSARIGTDRVGAVGLSLGGGAVIAVAIDISIPVVAWYPALAYQVAGDSLLHARLASERVLIIHGTADSNARSAADFSVRLARTNPQVGLILVEGGGHGYGSHRSVYIGNTVDSLTAWLGER